MKTVLTAIYNLFATLNPTVKLVIAAVTVAMALNAYINKMWALMFHRVDAITAGVMPDTIDFSALSFINYIFPLDTLCTFMTAYLVLRVTCAGVRIVKSFVPTIS